MSGGGGGGGGRAGGGGRGGEGLTESHNRRDDRRQERFSWGINGHSPGPTGQESHALASEAGVLVRKWRQLTPLS